MGAALALKLCGGFCLLRSMIYLISPNALMDMCGYPPAAAAGSRWSMKSDDAPSAEDILTVTVMVQSYALVQGGLGGLALSTARIGDPYTMSLASTMLGALSAILCLFAVSKMNQPGYEFIGNVANKLLGPLAILAVYMIYEGVTGLKKAKPAKQDIGQSGKMMGLVSAISTVQGLGCIFFFDKWMDTFGLSATHSSTKGIVHMLGPMWGICIVVGNFTRLGVIYAGHTASIYGACRAYAIYIAQMGVAVAALKNIAKLDTPSVGYQCWVLAVYFTLTYGGGTIADDMAAAAKAKKK